MDDRDGREAELFGVTNSGHVVAYGRDGSLSFQGGITASRGHEGDNAGATALIAALSGRVEGGPPAPVYGCEISVGACPLHDSGESP